MDKTNKPIFVAISDIHFNLNTLPLASDALRAALKKAEDLNIPLIVAGDLNDTKDIIRGKVANELIDILQPAKVQVYILEGNHDKINEKGAEHGLNYLRPYAEVVDQCSYLYTLNVYLIPYQNDKNKLQSILTTLPKHTVLVMHQGFLGAQMGDYIQDKSSVDPKLVKNFTVISGHYHRHQTLCTDKAKTAQFEVWGKSTVTYIGSPYTITFGEANDGPKGFLIVNQDGSFTREILNLRKHVIIECSTTDLVNTSYSITKDDLIWVKLRGTQSELAGIDKADLGMRLFGHNNYKLDKIVTESTKLTKEIDKLTLPELMDELIDNEPDSEEHKAKLKQLWRTLT